MWLALDPTCIASSSADTSKTIFVEFASQCCVICDRTEKMCIGGLFVAWVYTVYTGTAPWRKSHPGALNLLQFSNSSSLWLDPIADVSQLFCIGTIWNYYELLLFNVFELNLWLTSNRFYRVLHVTPLAALRPLLPLRDLERFLLQTSTEMEEPLTVHGKLRLTGSTWLNQ